MKLKNLILFIAAVAASFVVVRWDNHARQDRQPAETPLPVALERTKRSEPDLSKLTETHGVSESNGNSVTVPVGPLKLADIPAGDFKADLLTLPANLQQRVLRKLTENRQLFSDVNSIRVDSSGMIYYVCTFSTRPAGHEDASELIDETLPAMAEAEVSSASVPVSSPPQLHSRPGASKVLFLDFNGHVIENTIWNKTKGVAAWNCLPYDKDGDTNTFGTSELAIITQVWQRVAEDYAPFDVDVTTEQPASWNKYTGHALITPNVDANGVNCPHKGYGGIAYVDLFGDIRYSYDYWGDCYSPAWVLDYGAGNAAEAISHELGHNLALSHDKWSNGITTKEYYAGHVNGSISWGPIMGTGYNRNVSQWCKGNYYNAYNSSQDDLDIIADRLGYRPDDHGDNDASASALVIDPYSGALSQNGVIETTDDPDVFSFSTGGGPVAISASTYRAASGSWGGNLDILLELYDSVGSLVATNNPALDVNASISVSISAGTYYLHVKPVGVGNPMASTPTGYVSYGSLGQYWISGTGPGDADDDGIPNGWEILYFGGFTNAVATADSDGDGADNLTEYITGYNPVDSNSVFEITSFTAPPTGSTSPFILTWNPLEGRLYTISYASDLITSGFSPIPGAVNLPYTQDSYTDTIERIGPTHFYRVDVRMPE